MYDSVNPVGKTTITSAVARRFQFGCGRLDPRGVRTVPVPHPPVTYGGVFYFVSF